MGFESVKRFPAVKQEPGYLGCLLSHLNLLKKARDNGYKNILIFEDDFEFTISKEKFWELIDKVKNKDYDVIMLGANRPSSRTLPHNNNFVKVNSALTTSAYVVNSKFYDTLINRLEECVPKLIEKPNAQGEYSIDVCWMHLQPKSKWYLFNEKIGKQMASHSNIQKGFVNYQTGGIKQTAGFDQTGGVKNKKKSKKRKTRRSSLPRQS
jgi:GR25 family glycosyltransferase involved in LPS biosynthesis